MNTAGFKRGLTLGLMLAGIVLLGACRSLGSSGSCHKPTEYAQAKTSPPLKIPPGLQAPDTSQALRIPELNQPPPPPPPRSKGGPCLDAPPPYAVPKPAPEPAA